MTMSTSKRLKVDSTESVPFTSPGKFEDEVILTFTDEKRKLYVSKTFLSLASPVFNAMLSNKSSFKESQNKTIHFEEKKFENMLELLHHIHPRIQKPVTSSNVYSIIPLVHEYLIDGSKLKCVEVLRKLAKEYINRSKLEEVFSLLHVAVKYDYTDVIESTIKMVIKFENTFICSFDDWEMQYEDLPDSIKVKILEGRLRYKNGGRLF